MDSGFRWQQFLEEGWRHEGGQEPVFYFNFGLFAIGSCEEGLQEMFDEQGEEWKVVEQTLPVDIKLASLVVDRTILRL